MPCAAEKVDGLVEVVSGLGGAGGVGAAKRKVVEPDVEERIALIEGLGSPPEDFCGLAFAEEKFAALIASVRVEDRVFGLAFHLEPLGFREQALSAGEVAGLVEGVGECRARAHPGERVAAAVAVIDSLPGSGERCWYVAEGEVKVAEIAVTHGRVIPKLRLCGVFG